MNCAVWLTAFTSQKITPIDKARNISARTVTRNVTTGNLGRLTYVDARQVSLAEQIGEIEESHPVKSLHTSRSAFKVRSGVTSPPSNSEARRQSPFYGSTEGIGLNR